MDKQNDTAAHWISQLSLMGPMPVLISADLFGQTPTFSESVMTTPQKPIRQLDLDVQEASGGGEIDAIEAGAPVNDKLDKLDSMLMIAQAKGVERGEMFGLLSASALVLGSGSPVGWAAAGILGAVSLGSLAVAGLAKAGEVVVEQMIDENEAQPRKPKF